MTDIAWIVSTDHPNLISSYRYNALIPAQELGRPVLGLNPQDDIDEFLDRQPLDLIVICKPMLSDRPPIGHHPFVTLAQKAKKKGVIVCFHVTDWHFDEPEHQALIKISDQIIVQTNYLAEVMIKKFGLHPSIIEEPYEGPRGKPKFKPKNALKLIWYGHSANLDTLAIGLHQLMPLRERFELSVVTEDTRRAEFLLDTVPRPPGLVQRRISPFSLETQWREIRSSDIVLLPSNYEKKKLVKGHNRLVQSIHAGRLAIAFPLPQYRELEHYCYCTENLYDGISWALANKLQVFKILKSGQNYIDDRFSPSIVAARWNDELANIIGKHGATLSL